MSLDINAKDIVARLKAEGINYLYHFTSILNLPGILERNALLSKEVQESCGVWPCPDPGGNDISHGLDKSLGNWNGIALNLTPQTQMGYHKKREKHICFFLISTEVSGWKDIIFTDTNSARTREPPCEKGMGIEGLELINFDMVKIPFKSDDLFWHRYHQAEVLVPNRIPLEFVSHVAFLSDASMRLGERLWGENPHPDFIVSIPVFQDIPDTSDSSLSFPHISTIKLSDLTVNKSNYQSVSDNVTQFDRNKTSTLTAVIKLYVSEGTKGKILWSTNGVETEQEFSRTIHGTWFPHINLKDLPDGPGVLEVRLDNILWATSEYEVIS